MFLDGPVQRYCNNGKPRDDSGGAKRDNIEMISIVPPSDDNSFAHVSEEDDEETVAKELFLGPVHVLGNNGNLGDSSGGANSDSIEMISIVPPSDDNNFAQVSDTNCGKYIPTIGRRWAII